MEDCSHGKKLQAKSILNNQFFSREYTCFESTGSNRSLKCVAHKILIIFFNREKVYFSHKFFSTGVKCEKNALPKVVKFFGSHQNKISSMTKQKTKTNSNNRKKKK